MVIDGVIIVGQQHEIQYVNRAIRREFGPVEGQKCFEYFQGKTDVCPWCNIQETINGESRHWECYFSKSDKTYDLFSTAIENADGSISMLEFFHDITEKEHYNINYRIVLPNGKIRIVHEQAEVTHNKNKKTIHMVGTVHDITEKV
ncbi:MAG: PAS domain-containing protein [Proteobacteria bacterium]|nr:PAS domain-containing protein [Pseudomonadota bacterium]